MSKIFDKLQLYESIFMSGNINGVANSMPYNGIYIIRFNSPKGTASRKLSIIR